MQALQLTAVYQANDLGGYTCYIPEIPDVISEGKTLKETEVNLMDALELVLEDINEEENRKLEELSKSGEVIRKPLMPMH